MTALSLSSLDLARDDPELSKGRRAAVDLSEHPHVHVVAAASDAKRVERLVQIADEMHDVPSTQWRDRRDRASHCQAALPSIRCDRRRSRASDRRGCPRWCRAASGSRDRDRSRSPAPGCSGNASTDVCTCSEVNVSAQLATSASDWPSSSHATCCRAAGVSRAAAINPTRRWPCPPHAWESSVDERSVTTITTAIVCFRMWLVRTDGTAVERCLWNIWNLWHLWNLHDAVFGDLDLLSIERREGSAIETQRNRRLPPHLPGHD